MQRAQAGDRQAHAALYRAYSPMVFTLARRMLGSPSLAEDVLQDCFVEVIRKAGQYRGEASVGAWIRQIAVNKCLSQLRSPWSRRRVAMAGAAVEAGRPGTAGSPGREPAGPPVADPVDRLADRQALERALDAIPPTARAVVWLHAVEGYTHEEIGRLMGKSTSFSKSQLARACRRLREILEPAITDEEAEPCLGVLKTV